MYWIAADPKANDIGKQSLSQLYALAAMQCFAAASSAALESKGFRRTGRNPLRGVRLLLLTAPFTQGSLRATDKASLHGLQLF